MTKIEWVRNPDGSQGRSWNCVRGCSRVSEGCRNCYAERMAARFCGSTFDGMEAASIRHEPFAGFVKNGIWTGRVELIEDKLNEPLHWRKPQTIFVNSMSDLFHEKLPDEAIDRVFAVMALCPQHKFIVLTKRAGRMREYWRDPASMRDRWNDALLDARIFPGDARRAVLGCPSRAGMAEGIRKGWRPLCLPNVILGVSCEDQKIAVERIPVLLQTPAAMRFVSLEPLLGPVDLSPYLGDFFDSQKRGLAPDRIGWVIVGGESGPGARPCHPDWVRSIRDQCVSAGVPFFFKQWGEWLPASQFGADGCKPIPAILRFVKQEEVWAHPTSDGSRDVIAYHVGKRNAGRLLDGKEHLEFPEVLTVAKTVARERK